MILVKKMRGLAMAMREGHKYHITYLLIGLFFDGRRFD